MLKKIVSFSLLLAGVVLMGASCIKINSGTVGPVGVFRSDDKAETWKAVSAFPTAKQVLSLSNINVYRLFTDPSDPNTLYLGSRGQGLYYSYDNGETWQSFKQFDQRFIYALSVDPGDKCDIYVSDGPRIYKTVDCGRTWKLAYSEPRAGNRVVSISVDYADSSRVYGAMINGDILVSEDAGQSWRAVKRFPFTLQWLSVDPLTPGRIYVASEKNGLYRSDDQGATWIDLRSGLNNFSYSQEFYRLALSSNTKNRLFWVSRYGILRSDDAGETWNDVKLITAPGSVQIYAIAVNPKNDNELYYTGTAAAEGSIASTLYKTIDGGKSWVTKRMPSSNIPVALSVQRTQTSMVFLGFTAPEN